MNAMTITWWNEIRHALHGEKWVLWERLGCYQIYDG